MLILNPKQTFLFVGYYNVKEIFPYYGIGHFINQPTNLTDFEITRFAEMEEPEVDDFHKHSFYEIIWIDEGRSRQVIDYKEYEIHPGTLFFISPGQLHYFEEWHPVSGGSIFFTGDFFLLNQYNQDTLFELSFLDNVYADASIIPDVESYVMMKKVIDLLYAEHQRTDRSVRVCQSLLHVLLAQVQRFVESGPGGSIERRYTVLYKRFKQLLDKHFTENLSAGVYAEMLDITPHHLNTVTKNVTGKTATETVRARSLLEAKRLLTFSDYAVGEIAAQLNYFDGSYFTKIFRAETGMTPLEFKNTASEKYRKR